MAKGEEELTPLRAAQLADSIREQRELVRQIIHRHQWARARQLLHLNRDARRRFLALLEQAGMPAESLAGRCKTYCGRIPSIE